MYDQKVNSSEYTLKSSRLVLLAFATAFFSRIIAAVGVPSVVNFLHFLTISVVFGLTLSKTKTKIRSHISKEVLFSLFVLLGMILASALLNSAGAINVALEFLLLGEPFMLLLAIIGIRMTSASIKQFQFWMMLFAFIHLLFFCFQFFITGSEGDNVKGVFLRQGAGHHVGGAVALTASVYFFAAYRTLPIWVRAFIAIAHAADVVFSDSKQVVVVFVASLIVLALTKIKNIKEVFKYLAITVIAVGFVYLTAQIVFPSFGYWNDPEKLRASFQAKLSVFSIINAYYTSPFNWLLGLGPGHTIGRLGWLIPDYKEYLQPLGITSYPAVLKAVFTENDTNWLTNAKTGSSMFSLTFSWAGVWGDLGFLGLGAYLYLWFLVWRKLCLDNLSKFLLINMLIFGVIFSWLEEPGYMLFVVSLIGIQWQKHQSGLENNFANNSRKYFFLWRGILSIDR